MRGRRFGRWLLLLACVAMVHPGGPGVEAQEAKAKLFLRNGDLVTANGRNDSIIRMRLNPRGLRTTRVQLDTRLKPKGLDYSKFCEKIAIANSFNVVLYDVWSREYRVIEDDRFGLIADVQWDMACNLIIADMGKESVSRWPRDGHLWLYTPDGEIRWIAEGHHWVNPAFLDMDEWGTLYIVDKAAGAPIPDTPQWFYDAIYKTGAPEYRHPAIRYRRGQLQVTAFTAHPDGRLFIGNGDRLLVLEGNALSDFCGGSYPFRRINGLALDEDLNLFAVDGFDVYSYSVLLQLDDSCSVLVEVGGSRINGSQGLAVGLPSR